jgi:hypothetical protein
VAVRLGGRSVGQLLAQPLTQRRLSAAAEARAEAGLVKARAEATQLAMGRMGHHVGSIYEKPARESRHVPQHAPHVAAEHGAGWSGSWSDTPTWVRRRPSAPTLPRLAP